MTQQEIIKALRNGLTATPALMDAAADLIEALTAETGRKHSSSTYATAKGMSTSTRRSCPPASATRFSRQGGSFSSG